jgi:hypothetical protein
MPPCPPTDRQSASDAYLPAPSMGSCEMAAGSRRWVRRSVAGGAAALALVAAGCDLRQPMGSDGAAAPGLPRLDAAFDAGWTSAPLGGEPLAAPPNNGWDQFAWGGWRPTGIAVPESAWVHIRIEGGVDYRWNPDCAMIPPFWAGCGAHYEGESGTLSPWEGLGRVDVGLVSASGLIARLGEIEAVPTGEDGGVRSFLAFSRVPTTVFTLRHMVYGGGVSPMDGYIGIPAYFLTSHQRITVERVPTPLRVLAPSRVRPEEVFQASLDVFPPFRLRPPYGSHTLPIYWEHVAVDEAGREIGTPLHIGHCYSQPVCSLAVTRDGYLRAVTYVEMHLLVARSNLIRVGEEECPDGSMSARAASDADGDDLPDGCAQPELELICNGIQAPTQVTVTRGRGIACEVSNPDGHSIEVIRWSFRNVARTDGDPAAVTWAGPMAQGGRLEVRARVNGVVRRARQSVNVQPREWRDYLPDAIIQHTTCPIEFYNCLRYPPKQFQDIGKTYLPPFAYTLPLTKIVEGPNNGWWYFRGDTGPVQLPAPVTLLLLDVFDANSDFYKTRPQCNPAQVQTWLTAHEQRHVSIGKQRAASGYINGWLEPRTRFAPVAEPESWYEESVDRTRQRVENLMDPGHQLSYPPVPCDLKLKANTSYPTG